MSQQNTRRFPPHGPLSDGLMASLKERYLKAACRVGPPRRSVPACP